MNSSTVISDASWCPNQKVAGWACWVSGQGFSGPIGQTCKTSTEAETISSVIGIGIAFRVYKATIIFLQCDCTNVMSHLDEHLPPDVAAACTIFYQHVRGHTTIDAPRFAANRWCDTAAKQHMRALRK